VSSVTTKYNKEGKKVRIIKIQRDRRKDNLASDENTINLKQILQELRQKVDKGVRNNSPLRPSTTGPQRAVKSKMLGPLKIEEAEYSLT
jgi:TPP-dependent 2-oxoacid decarboxylase